MKIAQFHAVIIVSCCYLLSSLPTLSAAPAPSSDSVLLSGNFKELSLLMRGASGAANGGDAAAVEDDPQQQSQRRPPAVKPGFSYGFAHTAPLHGGAIGVLITPEEAALTGAHGGNGGGEAPRSKEDDVEAEREEAAGYLATQYHTQSHEGDAAFGYAHPGQAHTSIRDANGDVTGSYSYIAPDGTPIHVKYIADSAGFRVVSNALPDSNGEIPLHNQAAVPTPVEDTPEVQAAKDEHLRLFAAIQANRQQQRQRELQHSPLTQFLSQIQ